MQNKSPQISVIICTYNGASKISNCLDAVLDQKLTGGFDVIVVNDGSKDDTAATLANYRNITVITNKSNKGLAESRNIGARTAKTKLLAFTDDDCIPEQGWLANIVQGLDDQSVDAIGGKIVPHKTNNWLLRYYQYNNPLAHLGIELKKSDSLGYRLYLYLRRTVLLNKLPEKPVELYCVVGANMSMRKSVFELLHGFNPDFRFGGEEEEFWSRYYALPKAKKKLLYNPTAAIRHDYVPKFSDALRRNFSYGFGNARQAILARRRPVVYPFPIIFAGFVLLLGLLDCRLLFLLLPLGFTLYPGWIRVAWLDRKVSLLFFAFVQMGLEFATNCGVMLGLVRGDASK